MSPVLPNWLSELTFNADGLIPAIAQDKTSGQILMFAWMNREALFQTMATGQVVYWSRSRQCLWRKGEQSGHIQYLQDIRLDCDGDVVLLTVQQLGAIACHTGRASCFFRRLEKGANDKLHWTVVDPILKGKPSDQ